MTVVIIDDGDKIDWAIKTFRRKVQRSGILQDLRKKRYYVKPSDAKRAKAAAAVRRARKIRRRHSTY